MQIYLDYSATTPPRSEAITQVEAILKQQWGNPSSLHNWGQQAATILETARWQVANLINAPSADSIIFTSGGTEADNHALLGIARSYSKPQHLIISSVEHSAISETAQILAQSGWQVTILPVNRQGRVTPLELKAAIRPNTSLISIIYGQSEIGTIQPIEELAKIAQAEGVLFHTDAVQVAGRLPLDVQRLGVDLLSLSAHKIYGVQGAGALYVRPGVEIAPLLAGGGQERRLRSGTQAVPAIAAFGIAAEWAATEIATETPRLRGLRDRLFDLMADCPYLIPTGDRLYRLPHHVSFIVTDPFNQKVSERITGKTIVRQLNLAGIGISAGSACHSGKLSPSPILLAMGYSENEALGGIRLTLGRETTLEDIEWTAMVLKQVLGRLMPQLECVGC
ncbi:aminotransferase class V [Rippkaea orientalis PCC 8801]|uniref:cysteine desulfurase n=1 Tax=Rippkaea orientalis (strain PCC 8801 / RF-1) TaxID=41431 RepID=B7K5S7_RIPO1|nr:cysteine desulfurase family protein [Rippkaea orientalis]ACK67980.1 aminotransferase class V [Rippkaea orientalis PCC 8801]